MKGNYFMSFNRNTLGTFAFWMTTFLGLFLPIVTLTAVDIIRDGKTYSHILSDIVTLYFKGFDDFGFLFWLFQSLIFLLLAFLVKTKLQNKSEVMKPLVLDFSQAIGAWVVMVIFSVVTNINILISESSTAAIAYIFIPFYEVIMILMGYLLGWFVGRFILRHIRSV